MSTRSCAHSPSTSLTITCHQVKSLFIGLCNSFANCCCQLIFQLVQFFEGPISCFCFVFITFLPRKWLHCLSLYGTASSDFNIFLSASFLHFPSSLHTPLSTPYCIAAKSVAPVGWSHISSISSVLLSCLSFLCSGLQGPVYLYAGSVHPLLGLGDLPIAFCISTDSPYGPNLAPFA